DGFHCLGLPELSLGTWACHRCNRCAGHETQEPRGQFTRKHTELTRRGTALAGRNALWACHFCRHRGNILPTQRGQGFAIPEKVGSRAEDLRPLERDPTGYVRLGRWTRIRPLTRGSATPRWRLPPRCCACACPGSRW